MNIIERGSAFLQSLRELASRSVWDWKHCPRCGSTLTCKWGTYDRHPWFFGGRRTVAVQRHMCDSCHRTYSESSALLIRGSWYAREVHRCAIDHWQHLGTSLRRTAEVLRSWVGKQERYLLWRPLDAPENRMAYRLPRIENLSGKEAILRYTLSLAGSSAIFSFFFRA